MSRMATLLLAATTALVVGCSDDAEPRTATITVSVTGDGAVTSSPAGLDCGTACSATFELGTAVTLTATADARARFVRWSGACAGSGACTVTAGTGGAVAAEFTAACSDECTAGATACDAAGERACRDVDDDPCLEWAPAEACAAGEACVGPVCAPVATLTVSRAGPGSGTVSSTPGGIDCGADCAEAYPVGTMVTLTATPAADAAFAGWSGACTGRGACVVTLAAAAMVTATFSGACTDECAVGTTMCAGAGAEVTCGDFDLDPCREWSTPVACAPAELCGGDACAVAHTLTVARTGPGLVTSTPAGVDCGLDCSERYVAGTTVTLMASTPGGGTFLGWGPPCSGTGACAVTVGADTTVSASFAPPCTDECVAGSARCTTAAVAQTCGNHDADSCLEWSADVACGAGQACLASGCAAGFVVTVTAGGPGTVSVNGGPPCPGTCAVSLPAGSTAAVVATPDPASLFTGWSGACTGTGSCALTASGAVTATFAPRCVQTIIDRDPQLTGLDPTLLALDSNHLYWANFYRGYVKRRNLGGTPSTTMIHQGSHPTAIAVGATHVYWADAALGTISRWPKAGGAVETFATMQPAKGLAVDASHAYWLRIDSTPQGLSLVRRPLAGGAVEVLATGLPYDAALRPTMLAIDATHAYWTNGDAGTVSRLPLAGGAVQILASGQDQPNGIALTATHVWWTDYQANQLVRMAKAGGAVEVMAATDTSPAGLFVDGSTVGWASYNLNLSGLSQYVVGAPAYTQLTAATTSGWSAVANSSSAYFTGDDGNGGVIVRVTRSATCLP